MRSFLLYFLTANCRNRDGFAAFFMQKYNQREGWWCFQMKFLKNFARKELQSLDLSTQSSIIHAIEDVLEEVKQDEYERSIPESDL